MSLSSAPGRARSADRAAFIESAFEATVDLKAIASLDGVVTDANRTTLLAAQLDYDELIGRPLWLSPGFQACPEAAAWMRDAVAAAAVEQLPRRDLFLRRADGADVCYDMSVRLIAETPRSAPFLFIEGRDLTTRVRAESAALHELVAAETRFRAVLDAGLDAFVIVRAERDGDGTVRELVIVDLNTTAAELAMTPAEQLKGASFFAAYPHSRDTGLWEHVCSVLATRKPLEVTERAPLPDAPDRWVLRQFVPIADGVAISSRDITARQLERMALEASEARHRELFESNGAIQLLADAHTGQIVDVNPAAEAFYGWPRETMRSMLASDLDSSSIEDWRALGSAMSVGTGHPQLREHRVAGNRRRHVDTFTSVVNIAGRRVVHVIVQDVSDRLRAEALVRESEARSRAIVSSMREGLIIHDHGGTISAANPAAERILGSTTDEMLGLPPSEERWLAVHEDGTRWPVSEHPAQVALRTGESQPRSIMGVRRLDDSFVWLSVSASPLTREGETKPFGAVTVFSDITDERSAAERVRQAQKLEAVGQLAGGIAHDFNNLLTVIRGATGFLSDGLEKDSPHLEDVQAIERATVRAEELTRRLLAVGRRQLLQRTRIDLNELLREQQPLLHAAVPGSVALRIEAASKPAVASLDRARLLEAIQALVDNATAAMPRGGTLTLGTDLVRRERPTQGGLETGERRFVVLWVRDEGIGMPDDVKARLFEPFFSTQPFGNGRGMELASVHGMVAQSNGFIECDSEPGSGTTLRLFFPEASPAADAPAPPPVARASAQSRGVLLVDDDPLLRELARRMLEKLGHNTIVAQSGAEALEVLRTRPGEIAVMLTDQTMPEMTGVELIDEVQRRGVTLPIVAMSGYSLNQRVRDDLASRRIPFVAKPFTSDDLTQAIERALHTVAP